MADYDIKGELLLDTAKADRAAERARKNMEREEEKKSKAAERAAVKAQKAWTRNIKGIERKVKQTAQIITGLFVAIGAGIAKSVKAWAVQERAVAKLNRVLESTGNAAALSSGEIQKQARALQKLTGIGDEVIINAQAMMATFKNIKGDVFKRATVAALDMSVAIDQDLKSSVIQLGKALNDPILGMTALRRIGVSFTKEQVAMVKQLVNSGQTLKAQQIILGELESEFGGVASSIGKTGLAISNMSATWGDSMENIGKSFADAGLVDVLTEMGKGVEELSKSKAWDTIALKVTSWVAAFRELVSTAAAFYGGLSGGGVDEAIARYNEATKRFDKESEDRRNARKGKPPGSGGGKPKGTGAGTGTGAAGVDVAGAGAGGGAGGKGRMSKDLRDERLAFYMKASGITKGGRARSEMPTDEEIAAEREPEEEAPAKAPRTRMADFNIQQGEGGGFQVGGQDFSKKELRTARRLRRRQKSGLYGGRMSESERGVSAKMDAAMKAGGEVAKNRAGDAKKKGGTPVYIVNGDEVGGMGE